MLKQLFVRAYLLLIIISAFACQKRSPEFLTTGHAFDVEFTEEQEKAPAVVLLEEEQMEIVNSSEAYWDYRIVKRILKGRHPEEGIFKFTDNKHHEVISIRARAIHPDGREEILTERDIEKKPDFRDYVLYSDECSREFRFSGVRRGSLLEVFVRTRLDNMVYWQPAVFQYDIPVLKKTYRLIHPKDLPIRIYGINMNRNPDVDEETEGSRRELVWERTGIEPFEEEDHMPPGLQYLPSLWFAVLEDQELGKKLDLSSWEGINDWYHELSEESIQPHREVRGLLDKLDVWNLQDIEAARKIYQYVQNNIRYVAIILGLGGFKPHSTEETISKLYGDCKDQSTVLVSALRGAGIESCLVLVRTTDRGHFEEQFPFPGYFNHAIGAAMVSGRIVFLDPTCETCSFGVLPYNVQGADALIIRRGERDLITLPIGFDQENVYAVSSSMSIRETGQVEVRDTIIFQGFYATRYRGAFSGRVGESRKILAKKLLIGEYPFADIEHIEIGGLDTSADRMDVMLSYSIPNFVKPRETLFLNPLLYKLQLAGPLGKDRLYPFHLGKAKVIDYRVTVNIPRERRVTNVPDSLHVANEYFSYIGGWRCGGSGLEFGRHFRLEKGVVPVRDLQGLHETVKKINSYEDSKVVLIRED